MRIIFAGTPEISAAVLQSLLDNKYNIGAVLTQPDRAQGRGLKLTPSPVKVLAQNHNIAVLQPATLKSPEVVQQIKDLAPDLMIVLAYGLILPQNVLNIPRLGCINIHASLLPRWRGAAPIQHAILAADTETGITIMQMDAGMDTGDILQTYPCKIEKHYTAGMLLQVLTKLSQTAILDTLEKLKQKALTPIPQNNELATYAPKIAKADAQINWKKSAAEIERMVRAYNPRPIAFSQLQDTTIRIWEAHEIVPLQPYIDAQPGRILDINKDGIIVATGRGAICLSLIQLAGKKPMHPAQVIQANHELKLDAIFT